MVRSTLTVAALALALLVLAAWLMGAAEICNAQTPPAPPGPSAPPPPPGARPGSAPRGPQVFHIRPASGPIRIDGDLDDPGWRDAIEISDFVEVSPGENLPARVRTVVKAAYDADNIYFMARCYDPEPERIQAHLSDRDQIFDDDLFGVLLDTFRDQRTGYEFVVNPRGIQGDLSRNGDNEDASFDCLWSSAARIDSLGWTVEIAIPTRSLRFPKQDGQKWGFSVLRMWPRASRYQLSNVPVDHNNPCYVCQWAVLNEFHGLTSSRNLEVMPTVTMTSASTRDYLDGPRSTETTPKVGLNVKYGLSPSLILDGTVHPDFAQVEADQNQVSVNSASALFFTEKRPFFMEGSTIFQSVDPQSGGQFFYSRAVSDPEWAGKVTGHEGRLQLAVLAARDRSTQLVYPHLQGSDALDLGVPSTDGVIRGKVALHQESFVGFMGTGRSFGDGHSVLGALDGQVRFLGRLKWMGNVAASDTRDLPEVAYDYRGDSADVKHTGTGTIQDLSYTSSGYNGEVCYTGRSPFFRADVGHLDQNSEHLYEMSQQLNFRPAGRVVDGWFPSVYLAYQTDHDGVLRAQVVRPELYLQLKGQWTLDLQASARYTHYQSLATHHGAEEVTLSKNGSGLLTGNGQIRVGEDVYYRTEVLGRSSDLTGQLTARPSSRFTVTFNGELYRMKDHQVDTLMVAQSLGGVRLTYQFTPRLFVRLLSQYQRIECPYLAHDQRIYNQLSNQFLLSYKLNYASVFFLGLNGDYHDGLLNRDSSVPAGGAPFVQTGRQMFLKFQYLWQG